MKDNCNARNMSEPNSGKIVSSLGEMEDNLSLLFNITLNLEQLSNNCLHTMNDISLSKIIKVSKSSTIFDEKTIYGHTALAISKLYLYSYALNPIILLIEEPHTSSESISLASNDDFSNMIKNSKNGNLFGIMLGQLDFCGEIVCNDGYLNFKRGWKQFVEGCGIETSDTLFLQPECNSNKIHTCVVADQETMSLNSIAEEVDKWSFFINCKLIQSPKRNDQESSFYGFEDYFEKAVIEEDDLFVISHMGNFEWILELFRKTGIGMMNSHKAATEVELFIPKKQRECWTESVNKAARLEESDRVEMNDIMDNNKVENNEEVEEHMKFRETLNSTHVDKNSHGVYIPKWINPQERSWIVGERVTLMTETSSCIVGLVINNNRARFSAKWNEFVRNNELKVKDDLVFTLVEDGGNISFVVGIICNLS
ncbi:hypothetical protein POM88_007863 [Heracleum sosnowskyi]|uniref:TF-B3 domain-containing protein n=1 Tax=Heracleum sosnowskyi TaxID=360622 RepID=A0AAD8J567_9APIA|nr:hypothetical protein POM88_007863 [Heracleum sosnowskyi]